MTPVGDSRFKIPFDNTIRNGRSWYAIIWYFLAGFISGAVGMVLVATNWVRKHTMVVKITEEEEVFENDGHKES